MGDTVREFEKLLAKSASGKYVLRLYVAGNTLRSTRAIENIRSLCETYLKGRYELAIVDLFQEPERASEGQVVATPTLVKKLPPPLRRLIGDLSNRNRVLLALDLTPDRE